MNRQENARKLFTIHGLRNSAEYNVWCHMKSRCQNSNDSRYEDYGGRGISVCKRWSGKNGFSKFYKDIGPRPSSKYTLERKDNDGNYTPKNTRWATRVDQANNKRNNVIVEFKGERLTQKQAAQKAGIKYTTVRSRLNQGWSIEQVLMEPVRQYGSSIRH